MPSNKMNLWSTAAALLILLGAVETVTAAWNDVDDGDGDPLNNWDTVGVGSPLDVNGDKSFTAKAPGSGSPANQGACQTACTTNYPATLQGYLWGGTVNCVCITGAVAIHSTDPAAAAFFGTTYCLDCLNPSTSERSPSLMPSETQSPSLMPSETLSPSETQSPTSSPVKCCSCDETTTTQATAPVDFCMDAPTCEDDNGDAGWMMCNEVKMGHKGVKYFNVCVDEMPDDAATFECGCCNPDDVATKNSGKYEMECDTSGTVFN